MKILINYFSNFKNLKNNINLQLIIGEYLDLNDDMFENILLIDDKYKFFNSNSKVKFIFKGLLFYAEQR